MEIELAGNCDGCGKFEPQKMGNTVAFIMY